MDVEVSPPCCGSRSAETTSRSTGGGGWACHLVDDLTRKVVIAEVVVMVNSCSPAKTTQTYETLDTSRIAQIGSPHVRSSKSALTCMPMVHSHYL